MGDTCRFSSLQGRFFPLFPFLRSEQHSVPCISLWMDDKRDIGMRASLVGFVLT